VRLTNPLRRADDETKLVDALQAGDEGAFTELVDRYHASLVRLAGTFVRDRAVAEEVAQETWIAALNGIGRFERRSSLKTWLFRITANQAKTRAVREGRSSPFSSLGDAGPDAPTVDPDRFRAFDDPQYPGGWASAPRPWGPEQELEIAEQRKLLLETIDALPAAQRAVITLRDIQGLSAEEACNVLDLTDTNQRVLLHRARARVRQELERYFDEDAAT
jgi:RNA polymerase sigma-70 factor (ECF subfamily)